MRINTNYKPLSKIALAMAVALNAPISSADSEVDDKIKKLEAEIAALKSHVEKKDELEKKEEAKSSSAFSGTKVTYGGYIKLDTIVSKYSGGEKATAGVGEDFLVPSTIPVGGQSGDPRFHMHAKESRLFFKTSTDAGDAGTVDTHIEMDFMLSSQGDERISNSQAPRLRHAFVNWKYAEGKSFLAGQTWTTFFNVGALPDVLDFVGPVSTIFGRQPMLRWTNGGFQFAVENPASTLYGTPPSGNAANPYDDNNIPDVIARYNGKAGGLNWSLTGMARQVGYNTGSADQTKTGYGASLSGKYSFSNKDDFRFMVNYGNALGRYMGLNSFRSGQIQTDGSIELINTWGAFGAFRHLWNDQWRSSLVYAQSAADNPATVSDGTPKAYQSFHANLVYQATPKLSLGGEVIWAEKQIERGAEDKGDVTRFQFSVKYGF